MVTKVTPFRIIGNIYFVGTVEASSHLIDTGDGLILIDTGYPGTADMVVESIRKLGFDIGDVKIILHSHGHYDHTGATGEILKLVPNAKTYLSFHDIRYIDGFTPDFDIKDGDRVVLGNTEIECWFTPGHTEGSVSFFLDVTEGDKVYHAAMFGGSGVNQLKKSFMDDWKVPYLCRGLFFDSVERLLQRQVDVMLGNHTWQNHTLEKHEQMLNGKENPYIDPTEWKSYLTRLHSSLESVMEEDSRTKFKTYAIYTNNQSAFEESLSKGANGIRVSVQRTKDNVSVILDDFMLESLIGKPGKVSEYEYVELQRMCERKSNEGIVLSFKHFLMNYSGKELAFSVELNEDDIEKDIIDSIYEYGVDKRTMVTSFDFERLKKVKEYAPYIRVGYSSDVVDDEVIDKLIMLGVDEIRPESGIITEENVKKWRRKGFNICARDVSDINEVKRLHDLNVDGMVMSLEEISK